MQSLEIPGTPIEDFVPSSKKPGFKAPVAPPPDPSRNALAFMIETKEGEFLGYFAVDGSPVGPAETKKDLCAMIHHRRIAVDASSRLSSLAKSKANSALAKRLREELATAETMYASLSFKAQESSSDAADFAASVT